MTLNLIQDPWIPVRRATGREERIAPWQVTDPADPVVAVASPRADFDGALVQLWIGLLQTVLAPQTPRDWRRLFDRPPSPGELRQALEPIADAFDLLGDGPRFLQDLTLARDNPTTDSIGQLLIDEPGGNTLREGKDHFIKGGRIDGLCPACAAAALLTLQINAPSGGQGHRTGIRGGGPLTTLVRVDPGQTDEGLLPLWATLWLNVLEARDLRSLANPEKNRPEDRFPWLAPTRTSEKATGRETTPQDVHPLQLYWAMPRRIRLGEPDEEGRCSLCDRPGPWITWYFAKNLGINYTGPWEHPLSPHRFDQEHNPLPRHGDATGLSYRNWLGFVQSDRERNRAPARVVAKYLETESRRGRARYRLWGFGYDMDNMKARAWCEGTMPLYLAPPQLLEAQEAEVNRIVLAARQAEDALVFAVKCAFRSRPKDVKGDLSDVSARFWQETESPFFNLLPTILADLEQGRDTTEHRRAWRGVLATTALEVFEAHSQSGMFEAVDARRVATARNRLQRTLFGKKLRETLDLPKRRETPSPEPAVSEEVTS